MLGLGFPEALLILFILALVGAAGFAVWLLWRLVTGGRVTMSEAPLSDNELVWLDHEPIDQDRLRRLVAEVRQLRAARRRTRVVIVVVALLLLLALGLALGLILFTQGAPVAPVRYRPF